MNNLFSHDTVAGFVLQVLVSHWFVAIILVSLVAVFVTYKKSLNATTRHNVWLITLFSFMLMPLIVFMPKPNVDLNFLELFNLQSIERVDSRDDRSASMPIIVNDNLSNSSSVVSEKTLPSGISLIETSDLPVSNSAVTVPIAQMVPLTSVLKGILVFWLIGSIYFVRRLWGEYRAARELELQSDSVTPYFEERFARLCERLGLEEKPLLRFHAGINAPMTVGLYRVWVAIPMTWREEIDDDIFDQTLTHELGHIARKDPLIHTIQRFMNIIFWMYPAVWYVARQLELERESACDDWVLTHDGKGHTYANNLLNVAESLYLQPNVLAVGCLRSHSQLSRRIQNLLNKSSDHAVKNSWKLLTAVSAGLFLTLSVSAFIWPDADVVLNVDRNDVESDRAGQFAEISDASHAWDSIKVNKTGSTLALNGVDFDPATSRPAHNPISPVPPMPPKVIINQGGEHIVILICLMMTPQVLQTPLVAAKALFLSSERMARSPK